MIAYRTTAPVDAGASADRPETATGTAKATAGPTPDMFGELVRRESNRVARLLVHLLGRRADLEDLVQTVFLEFFRSWPALRDQNAVSAFIGGITVRVARRARRPSWWGRVRCTLVGDPPSPEPGPEAAATVSEQTRRVRRALDRLAAPKREAFILWALHGLEVEAIAEITGCSVSATRSRIFHAQKELKRKAARDPYLRELMQDEPGPGSGGLGDEA